MAKTITIYGNTYHRVEAYSLQHIVSSKALDIYCDSSFSVWRRDEDGVDLYALTDLFDDVMMYDITIDDLEENLRCWAGEEE